MQAEEIPGGAALTVTGNDTVRIRALGFIGVMTVGMHHQATTLRWHQGRTRTRTETTRTPGGQGRRRPDVASVGGALIVDFDRGEPVASTKTMI